MRGLPGHFRQSRRRLFVDQFSSDPARAFVPEVRMKQHLISTLLELATVMLFFAAALALTVGLLQVR
jgi:hypothetical protein